MFSGLDFLIPLSTFDSVSLELFLPLDFFLGQLRCRKLKLPDKAKVDLHLLHPVAVDALRGMDDDFFNKVNSNAKCFQFSREMQEKFALDFTYELSSGFKVIWYLYKNGYKNLKIYGFSFLNKNCSLDRFDHYFEKVKKKEKLHNINEEILLLRKIMNSIE